MGIVVVLLAAMVAGWLAALIYLLLHGLWGWAALLCLVAWGLCYLAKAAEEPWHGGPQ